MAAHGTIFGEMAEVLGPMWLELSFMMLFLFGFALRTRSRGKGKPSENPKKRMLHDQIAADVEAGHKSAALSTWNTAKVSAPVALETLKIVVQVLLETKGDVLVQEMLEYFGTHRQALDAKSVTAVLEVVARAGRAQLLDELLAEFKRKLHVRPSAQAYEVLLGGHAASGNESRVFELYTEMAGSRLKLTARGFSLTIKGFLKNGMLDAALRQIEEMSQRGLSIPAMTIVQLFRAACQKERGEEIFEAARAVKSFQLPGDAIVVLLEDCLKRDDLTFALNIEKVAKECGTLLPFGAYDALLKICVTHAETYALELFQRMQQEGLRVSEGLCVGLLARCAEAKFLTFAEEVARFVRGSNGMTIACYSTLMKVYAHCGLHEKACDLYAEMRADGLEPDSMMYGCLMKYSLECGRTDLSQELFEKSPSVQSCMSLIKAAGRDKDVNQAFAVLEKLKKSGADVDVAAYNCVLDACVSTGDMTRARKLVTEMQGMSNIDLITYNTLLKGYCAKNDVRGAKDVLLEIGRAGFTPNDISYNCLINCAVTSGSYTEAWNTVDMMERSGVAVDHFTLAIMLKGLKKVQDANDVDRTFKLLDRSGVDICSHEVLLNTVLETCTRHRHSERLERIVADFTKSKIHPSVHTYGSLIKACSALKRLDKCELLWHMMVSECAMEPNGIVLGCMLDAYVCNDKVEEAVELLNKWKTIVAPHTVMYSTVIKGFANSRQPARALAMWRELCGLALPLNTVVYNAIIDSQARVGAMDEVSKILESMEPQGCSPDHITYSMIVKGYCVKGDLDKAFEVFQSMQTNGMAVNEIVYNTVIDGCTKKNRMDLVDMVMNDMAKYGIKPSVYTLGILVKMYGKRHELDKAFEVIEDFRRKHGVRVNCQVRTSLMCACLSNHDFDRAIKVFKDIKEAGRGADAKTYSTLLAGLVRSGRLQEAADLVDDAFGFGESSRRGLFAGQVIEPDALQQLLRVLTQRQPSLGAQLRDRLTAAGVPFGGGSTSSAAPKRRGR